MYYAILDRERYPMMLCNACVRVCPENGERSDPYYFFSISGSALRRRPWRTGTVYLLPGDTFEIQPRLAAGDVQIQVAQAASPVPVKPVAKLTVGPGDFPFLEQIRGHDDALLQARVAADPHGFPWLDAV
jgi:ferredoxin